MFVISVGVLGLFTLFPSAMRASQHAQEDTTSSMFAEMAFATLRSASHSASDAEWLSFGQASYPIASLGWDDITFQGNSGIQDTDGDFVTVTFTSRPEGTQGVINHMVQYNLSITGDGPGRSRSCRLQVKGTGSGGIASTFYTEIFRTTMTP